MLILDKIKNILENKRFNVYEVNIPLESLNSGIQFENYDKLERFMNEQSINVIFFSKYYDNEENYLITKETLRKSIIYLEDNIIDVISNDINKYNKQITKTDKYKNASEKSYELYNQVKNTMTNEEYDLFGDFVYSYTNQMVIEIEEYFVKGFSMANKLRYESLTK